MDHRLLSLRDRIFTTLRTRISRLPKFTQAPRFPRWAWILPLALVLSMWAHHGSQAEGRLEWLTTHAPTQDAWKEMLLRRGFAPLEDPVYREKAYAEMPESSRRMASAYLSEDHQTVALRVAGDWIYFELKNAPGKAIPGQVVSRELWEGLGTGWEAFSALESIEFPIMRTAKRDPNEEDSWKDPRSIEY